MPACHCEARTLILLAATGASLHPLRGGPHLMWLCLRVTHSLVKKGKRVKETESEAEAEADSDVCGRECVLARKMPLRFVERDSIEKSLGAERQQRIRQRKSAYMAYA